MCGVGVVGVGGASCGRAWEATALEFCAIMSDSVGLYLGNPVTQMGFKIGTVTSIEPRAMDAQIGFEITDNRHIPQDVRAVPRSPSLLTYRSLELVGNYEGGPQLTAGNCIPLRRSHTPMSISKISDSATTFL